MIRDRKRHEWNSAPGRLREILSHAAWECRFQWTEQSCAPNKLDLNRVDYAIWQRVYHGKKFDTVDQLKQLSFWSGAHCHGVSLITALVMERRRLQCVVNQNGGHIEHTFY